MIFRESKSRSTGEIVILNSNMKQTKVEPSLLSTSQAAALVGVKIRTWYTWDRLGFVPKPVKISKKLFWRREELLAWIDEDCPKREDWLYRPKK